MSSNKQNSWFNWLKPRDQGSISPSSQITLQYIGGKASRTGEQITAENALQNPTVFACVSLLAQTIAQLPWGVSQKGVVGYSPVDHPLEL